MATSLATQRLVRPHATPLRFGTQPAALAARSSRFARRAIFRPRTEHELFSMADEQLVRYVADAKRAGAREHAVTATHMLLFKHQDRMLARVRLRLPSHLQHQAQTVADWVLERVSRSALTLSVTGESVGEWVNWWGKAIDRQVISFWRTTQGQAIEKQALLPAEHEGEDDAPADALGEDFDVDRAIAQASIAEALEAALARMDNAEHVAILRRAMPIWDDQPSKLVAEEFGTTAMNVDQIKSRFRTLVREECERRGWGAS